MQLSDLLLLAATGFATGLGLIVAIGAQNAFVLRQGIRREHIVVVIAVCALIDAVLIVLGTAGIGTVMDRFPWLISVLRWGGVAYLLWFAVGSVRSALSGGSLRTDAAPAPGAGRSAVQVGLLTASLSLLNPHVYLDTVVMLGSIANQQENRWVFSGGAVLASFAWFSTLGWGADRLAPLLRSPRAWMAIDLCVAAVMVFIAAKLAFAF